MKVSGSILALGFWLVLSSSQADDTVALGRLFFTPQQRTLLDQKRMLNPGQRSEPGEQEGSQTLNGEVRRSSGRTTRWVNGEAQWNGNALRPPVPVGDTLNPATGERESLLRGGRIIVRRPATAP